MARTEPAISKANSTPPPVASRISFDGVRRAGIESVRCTELTGEAELVVGEVDRDDAAGSGRDRPEQRH